MRGVAAASKARWDKEHGVFIYDGAELPPALAPFRAQPYSWGDARAERTHRRAAAQAITYQGEHDDAPRSEVIHDLRWSAIQMAQIEGRCHRDGRFAQVYWTYADDTVEEKIARVVAGRIQSMKEMIGDDTETLREIENLLRG